MNEALSGSVTIVTQTRVLAGYEDAFAVWQEATKGMVARFPGFIEQSLTPPTPPTQVDWVILQRFTSTEAAVGWLNSKERIERIAGVQHMLAGRDDVHLVNDGAAGVLPSPISAVISTRLKPGQERTYRTWEQRMAAVQSRAPGFQGYRFEAPIPGVQEDWLSILRLVGVGMGVTIGPACVRLIAPEDVVCLPLRGAKAVSNVELAWHAGDTRPIVERFRQLAQSPPVLD